MITWLMETTSATPSPESAPIELWEASPGLAGFLYGFFAIGIALVFLMWSMNRHLRRITYEERRRARHAQDITEHAPHDS